ncbi:DNA-binding MurR/RpiR family transcriptional regulator [Cytobacillus kochii]|nr:DNA-binding MurR/RpiR family transcriptional regulator [Cytobacillus kochii]
MIIRFCCSIGFDGFTALQKEVRKSLMTISSSSNINSNQFNHFTNELLIDGELIKKNIESIDIEEVHKAIDQILDSERIIVLGYYQSYSFAHWLYFNLNYILGNATLYRPESDARLLELLPINSCVIVFSFYRYALDTIKFAKDAKAQGLKVIAFTDSKISPITEHADAIIPIQVDNHSIFRKGPITLSIMNALLHELLIKVDHVGETTSTFKYFIKENSIEN